MLTACMPPPQVRFQLVTDLAPGREFDEVEVVVAPEGEARTLAASAERSWGRGVRVATLDGLPAGSHEVRVTLRLSGALVQQQARRFVTASSGTSTVTILVTRDCVGVTCSPDEACAAAQCVSIECTPETPATCPTTARCTASSCSAPSGCVVPECRAEGFCFSAPDDSRCDEGQYCDTVLGCLARGLSIDAGASDAEVPDAGADAGPPPSGGAITFPWNGALTSATPTLRWALVAGATETEVVIDDSCDPFAFVGCGFPSPELDTMVTTASLTVPPLAVSAARPVGRRYFVRVRPCNVAGCGSWSSVRYFDAGRVRGDVNGDGFSDAIIGAPTGAGQGAAHVLYGGAGGSTGLSDARPIPPGSFTPEPNDLFGSEVAFLGDLDADGCADFAVGAPGGNTPATRDVGMLHVYLGSSLAGPGSGIFTMTQISPSVVGSRFSGTIAGIGDVDLDGRADVAIGAAGEAGGGAVYVLLGRDRETGTLTRIAPPNATDAGFGTTIALLVERGIADFPAFLVSSNGSPGAVYRFAGSATGLITTPIGFPPSPRSEPLDGFGSSIDATCDIDGDGNTDAVLGSPAYRGEGGVVVMFDPLGGGPSSWIGPPSVDESDFGWAVACADLTGDGIEDVLATSTVAGTAFVYAGGGRTLALAPLGELSGSPAFGFTAATGFDFDGDGNADTLYGVPATGEVAVELGPRTATPIAGVLVSGAGAGDQFGYAIAVAPP
jgi:hypothetical protein